VTRQTGFADPREDDRTGAGLEGLVAHSDGNRQSPLVWFLREW
jgi:hypothetical protein